LLDDEIESVLRQAIQIVLVSLKKSDRRDAFSVSEILISAEGPVWWTTPTPGSLTWHFYENM
jgi:predicted CoA-binding protein